MSSLGLISFSGYSVSLEWKPSFCREFRVLTHAASPPPPQSSDHTSLALGRQLVSPLPPSPLLLTKALCSLFSACPLRVPSSFCATGSVLHLISSPPPPAPQSESSSLARGPPGTTQRPWEQVLRSPPAAGMSASPVDIYTGVPPAPRPAPSVPDLRLLPGCLFRQVGAGAGL